MHAGRLTKASLAVRSFEALAQATAIVMVNIPKKCFEEPPSEEEKKEKRRAVLKIAREEHAAQQAAIRKSLNACDTLTMYFRILSMN